MTDPSPTNPLPRARVRASFAVGPLDDIHGNLATVVGESILSLLGMFYPVPLCRKANVVVTELIQNVLANTGDPSSEMRVDVDVRPEKLAVEVTNRATVEQGEAVLARIDELRDAVEAKKRFATTLHARRAARLTGGLGLMRLVAENRFTLSGRHEHGDLSVRAEFTIRGSE